MHHFHRFGRSGQGATAVETAIIITALMPLIFGMVQFAQIFWTWNTMLLGIEEAGRYAMVYNPTNFPNFPSGAPACGANPATLSNCAVAQANTVLAAYPSPNVTVSCSAGCEAGGATMTFQGTFTFNFITPVLFPYGPITLTSQYTVPLS
jgi:Flp pilus assembly protein TadG